MLLTYEQVFLIKQTSYLSINFQILFILIFNLLEKKNMKMKIAVLTGGGDCPGLNGAIKWVTKSALDLRIAANRSVSFEIVGIVEGWKGIV